MNNINWQEVLKDMPKGATHYYSRHNRFYRAGESGVEIYGNSFKPILGSCCTLMPWLTLIPQSEIDKMKKESVDPHGGPFCPECHGANMIHYAGCSILEKEFSIANGSKYQADTSGLFTKDGRIMTTIDAIKDLNRKSFLEENKLKLEAEISSLKAQVCVKDVAPVYTKEMHEAGELPPTGWVGTVKTYSGDMRCKILDHDIDCGNPVSIYSACDADGTLYCGFDTYSEFVPDDTRTDEEKAIDELETAVSSIFDQFGSHETSNVDGYLAHKLHGLGYRKQD